MRHFLIVIAFATMTAIAAPAMADESLQSATNQLMKETCGNLANLKDQADCMADWRNSLKIAYVLEGAQPVARLQAMIGETAEATQTLMEADKLLKSFGEALHKKVAYYRRQR